MMWIAIISFFCFLTYILTSAAGGFACSSFLKVNYFGMICVTKAFFPLFKAQACGGQIDGLRILNIISMAGLVTNPIAPSYIGSKHAAEAFSACLRHEMQGWGVKVVSVNPSFHGTPLVNGMEASAIKLCNTLSGEQKEEYGEGGLFS